jgi:hypothetical protein
MCIFEGKFLPFWDPTPKIEIQHYIFYPSSRFQKGTSHPCGAKTKREIDFEKTGCFGPGAENTKGGSITVPLTSFLTGLDLSFLQIKTKIASCHTADSKSVKQEVNIIVILPPLVFLAQGHTLEAR